MNGGFRVFDTHTHIGHARHSGRTASADDLLRNMDRHGVDRSLVVPYPVVEDHRREHDLIGRAVKAHPDRLVGAACLNPHLPSLEFRDEVRRCREVYGFRALKLQPQYPGREDGPAFLSLCKRRPCDVGCQPVQRGGIAVAALHVREQGRIRFWPYPLDTESQAIQSKKRQEYR